MEGDTCHLLGCDAKKCKLIRKSPFGSVWIRRQSYCLVAILDWPLAAAGELLSFSLSISVYSFYQSTEYKHCCVFVFVLHDQLHCTNRQLWNTALEVAPDADRPADTLPCLEGERERDREMYRSVTIC